MTDTDDPALLAQTLIYAGLDALRSAVSVDAVPLDLCAYLHRSGDEAPQLYLGVPNLAEVEPSEAFNLFAALKEALDEDHDGDRSRGLAGYHATLVTTEGSHSRGLHVFGRRDEGVREPERRTLVRLAGALGAFVHQIDVMTPAAAPKLNPVVLRVAVEMMDQGARAEVGITFGAEFRTGTADAGTAARAVALAAAETVDASFKVIEAVAGDIADTRAVLVLVSDSLGRQELGAALTDDTADPLRATADAALEAAWRLARL